MMLSPLEVFFMRLSPLGLAACGLLPGNQAACVTVVIPADDYRVLHAARARYGEIPGVLPAWLAWCADSLRNQSVRVDDSGRIQVCTPFDSVEYV